MKTLEEKKQRFAELATGKQIIKSDYQKAVEAVNSGNAANVKAMISVIFDKRYISELKATHGNSKIDMCDNFMGKEMIEMIAKNANDFTKDIATNVLGKEFNPSEKQAWCLAYQIMNNKQVYLDEIMNSWNFATADMKEDDVISKESVELSRLGYEIFAETL